MSKKPRKKKLKKKKRPRRPQPALQKQPRGVWLNVLPNDLWLEVERGTTVMKALQKADIELPSDCGGLGKCGKCKVRVLTSTGLPPANKIAGLLDEEELRLGIRLACQTVIKRDMAVYLGESDPEIDYFQILKTGTVPLLEFNPLIEYCPVEFKAGSRRDGSSDLDRLRKTLGSEYHNLQGSLTALRALGGQRRKQVSGTAVVHQKQLLAWRQDGESGGRYGLVFDLGTSTVVAKVINLDDGQQQAAVSCLNSQSKYGADVISRLQHVMTQPEGLERLHLLLVHDLNRLVRRLLQVTGLRAEDILIAVAAGNTTMQHFLLGLNPAGIAEAPFAPVLNDGVIVRSSAVGLVLHPEAVLYIMPSRSGYIGGDLLGVVLASQAADQDEKIILGLDLGTNGEMFLGNRRRLLTCSTAAGPALEGAKISHGTIARAGAIEGVRFLEGQLHYKDIGNIKPTGICGSGLVDLVAVLVNCGIIDTEGLIRPPAGLEDTDLYSRVIERDGVYDFLVSSAEESYHHRPIYLTQKDVRELQFAKAAIAAGLRILLDELGVGLEEVDYIYLAGALGNYVNPYSAMRIGLLPRVSPEIVFSLGNAASTGAAMVLLSKSHWLKANRLAHTIEHIELSTRADFTERFINQMDFPEEYEWERRHFPSCEASRVAT